MQLLADTVAITLTNPASDEEVERIWSGVSHTLDDKPLSMVQETLEYCLHVKRSKMSLDNFDRTGAVNLW